MRRARHVDANHVPLRNLARALFAAVEDTSDVGRGFPDLVGRTHRGTVYLIEVKNPNRAKSRRALQGQQADMALRWGDSYRVVETEADVVELART